MRNKRLDILRCVAILLVLTAHSRMSYLTMRVGWVGVDLFFVLSGFLISGLLYSEYKRRQDISFRRFFLRRGLKIYPAFYVLILATYAAQHLLWRGAPSPLSNFLNEVIFIQNYRYGVWGHTWSLAVEEHFYIGLAVLLLVLARLSSDRANPFRSVPWIFAGVATVLPGVASPHHLGYTTGRKPHRPCYEPYTRIDSLFFGVFLGYLYHFRPEATQKFLRPPGKRLLIGIVSAVLLSTCYFFDRDGHFLLSVGLTFLYLGFGGLLVLSLPVRNLLKGRVARIAEKVGTGCAFIGKHSYSIYLWHTPLIVSFPVFERKVLHRKLPFAALVAIYVAGSCALGIFFANLIEFPVFTVSGPVLSHAATARCESSSR